MRGPGIGSLTDQQIADAIRSGRGRHGGQRIIAMPWPAFSKLTDADTAAIVAYLRSLPPVAHEVPADVLPGERARAPYVHYGVYRSRN